MMAGTSLHKAGLQTVRSVLAVGSDRLRELPRLQPQATESYAAISRCLAAARCSPPLRMSMSATSAVATYIRAFRASGGGLVVMVAVIWSGCRGAGGRWPR